MSHLLDQILQLHGHVYDSFHWRFITAGKLDEGDKPGLQGELCLNRGGAEGDDGSVGRIRPQLPALEGKVGEPAEDDFEYFIFQKN